MRAATVTAAPALVILVALFSCLAVVGVKNASASCSLPLAPFLVAFGSVGLTFTAVHLHYTAYYAGCAEAPRRPTFVLGLVSFSALCLAAVALLALTYAASTSASRCTRPLPLERLRERLLSGPAVAPRPRALLPACRDVRVRARRAVRARVRQGAAGRAPHGRAAAP